MYYFRAQNVDRAANDASPGSQSFCFLPFSGNFYLTYMMYTSPTNTLQSQSNLNGTKALVYSALFGDRTPPHDRAKP